MDDYLPKVYTLGDLGELPQPDWLIQDMLQQHSFAVIHGDPASGKSLLAQDWAMCVQNGIPWLGKNTIQSDVLWLIAEGQSGIHPRSLAWQQARFVDFIPPVTVIIDVPDLWHPPDRPPSPEFAAIEEHILTGGFGLVIVDTLSATFGGGNENMQQDMNQFVRACQRLMAGGATVMVNHHNAKSTQTVRGSTVLKGACDQMIETDATFADGKIVRVKVSCTKRKDGMPFKPFYLQGDDYLVNTTIGTSVAFSRSQDTGRPPRATNQLVILRECSFEPKGVSHLAEVTGKSTSSVQHWLKSLAKESLVEQTEPRGPWLTTELGRAELEVAEQQEWELGEL